MRYIVQKAPGVDGPPIPEDEPCLVIRAQDMFALDVMDFYLHHTANYLPLDVADELRDHRERLIEWRRTHKTKLPDR